MAEIAQERFEEFMRDSSGAAADCWMEVFRDQLELDLDAFRMMEEANALRIYVGRDRGKVVGFLWVMLQDSLMQRTNLEAHNVGLVVVPEYRRGWFAWSLIAFAEEALKNEGVKYLFLSAPSGSRVGVLLGRLGYSPVETIYQKELRKESSWARQ